MVLFPFQVLVFSSSYSSSWGVGFMVVTRVRWPVELSKTGLETVQDGLGNLFGRNRLSKSGSQYYRTVKSWVQSFQCGGQGVRRCCGGSWAIQLLKFLSYVIISAIYNVHVHVKFNVLKI